MPPFLPQPMPAFPVPVFAAALLLWVLLRGVIRREVAPVLLWLIAICGAQALITALALHYGLAFATLLRPVTASMIPALAWLAFTRTAVRALTRGDLVHGLGPAFTLFCLIVAPEALDAVIPALFLGYGLIILWALRKGGDGLPRLTLAAGERPSLLWRLIGVALLASALSDALIVLAQAMGQAGLVPWIVSLTSSLTLVLMGGLALTPDLAPDNAAEPAPEPDPGSTDPAAEAELLARLDALLQREPLYLDPDLSLARLARRLHVPAKRLSEAVNRQTGRNVARYLNGFRIRTATARLMAGDTVTEAMLASGFSTKSNFNRAFLIETGVAPSQWRSAPPRLPLPHPD